MVTKSKEAPAEDKIEAPIIEDQEEAQEKPKYDKDELLAIFDAIMFEGEYQEEVVISKKLKVVFVTRTADQVSAIERELDGKSYVLFQTQSQERVFLSVLHSVKYYAGKNVGDMPLEERRKFFGKLPAVVISALSEALVKFDGKTMAACQEGEENF